MMCRKERQPMLANAAPERLERLAKARLNYPHTYTLPDQVLPARVPSSSGIPRPRKAPNIVARKRRFVEQFQADLGHPVSRAKIFRFPFDPNQRLFPRVRSRQEGRIAIVTNARRDVVDAAASGAKSVRRAVIRERVQRARRTALKRTAKPCGPGTRGWCQAGGG
jgi:hypothetical protein